MDAFSLLSNTFVREMLFRVSVCCASFVFVALHPKMEKFKVLSRGLRDNDSDLYSSGSICGQLRAPMSFTSNVPAIEQRQALNAETVIPRNGKWH